VKRIFLLHVTVIVMIFATACGGSAPTPTSTVVPTSTPIPQSTVSVNNTEVSPTLEDNTINATEVNITLEDNTIKSSQTTFQAGVQYAFVIQNGGSRAHDFNIAPPVSVAGSLDAALSSALLAVSRDKLQAGESVTVEYTFPDSAASQQLEFSCLIPRHYQDGMLLAITVTK